MRVREHHEYTYKTTTIVLSRPLPIKAKTAQRTGDGEQSVRYDGTEGY